MPHGDVREIQAELSRSGDKQFCASKGGGCIELGARNERTVILCSIKEEELCVDSARAARHIGIIADRCRQKDKVSGKQDIFGIFGLSVQI